MDGGYAGPKPRDALRDLGRWAVQIVKRSDTAEGFEVLPRRWVVEHTFAWLNSLPAAGFACACRAMDVAAYRKIGKNPSQAKRLGSSSHTLDASHHISQ